MTQPNWPNPMPPPPPGYGGYPPPKKWMSGGAIAAIVIAVIVVLGGLAALIIMPVRNRMLEQGYTMKSQTNLRQIGLACIQYANEHRDRFPGSLSELINRGYISPSLLVDPGSSDTPLLMSPSTITEADLVGHCSYVYVGQGQTTRMTSSQSIVAYESLSSHTRKRIGVVYVDGHGETLSRSEAERMISQLQLAPKPPVTPEHSSGTWSHEKSE